MPLLTSNEQWTYSDAVESLLDFHELEARTGLNERRARYAIQQAYRDLPSRAGWSYYYRQRLLQTVAPQSSSTITYDHTGGASERLVTIAAGTWPSWAAFGRLIIDETHYEVDRLESSTTLTLTETSNPGADLAALTTYTLYRSAYALPANFRSMVSIYDVDEQRNMPFVDAAQYHHAQSYEDTPSTPTECMIRATGEYYGGHALHFNPPPDEAATYDVLYMARPRPLLIDEYNAGTVAVTLADATVTLTGGIFPLSCEGSVIRFSSNGAPPTGLIGSISGTDNPYVMQSVIKTRTSATEVELEEDATVAIAAGSGYVISDPLDIEPGSMLTALLKAAEAEFSSRAGREDAQYRLKLARQALLEAMEADSRVENTSVPQSAYNPFVRTNLTSE